MRAMAAARISLSTRGVPRTGLGRRAFAGGVTPAGITIRFSVLNAPSSAPPVVEPMFAPLDAAFWGPRSRPS